MTSQRPRRTDGGVMNTERAHQHPGHAHHEHGHHDHAHVPVKPAGPAPVAPVLATRAGGPVEYTCPMHPEIIRDAPGSCPICGMALEPRTVAAVAEENPELRDMSRRFWTSVALGVPLVAFSMLRMTSGLMHMVSPLMGNWIELWLATP